MVEVEVFSQVQLFVLDQVNQPPFFCACVVSVRLSAYDGRTDGRTGGHVFGMPLVKLRFLFANYDRVETTQEYDLETTTVDTIRSELFEKIPELNLPEEEKVENFS